jgi:hypothetical protein
MSNTSWSTDCSQNNTPHLVLSKDLSPRHITFSFHNMLWYEVRRWNEINFVGPWSSWYTVHQQEVLNSSYTMFVCGIWNAATATTPLRIPTDRWMKGQVDIHLLNSHFVACGLMICHAITRSHSMLQIMISFPNCMPRTPRTDQHRTWRWVTTISTKEVQPALRWRGNPWADIYSWYRRT